MIVKNESKIIERLLASVAPWIDSYCICDTGSTDNTIELIQGFFEKTQTPGKIVQEPFRNFGYNRSFALKACESIQEGADYILLLDADMVFQPNPTITKDQFRELLAKSDVHNIFQGTEAFLYKNIRIVRNYANIAYIGVTHEYVNVPSGLTTKLMEKSLVFILDVGDGGSKQDKFLRDIRLLTQGIIDEPENIIRYTFYLANSYRDSGQRDLAIETYKKRATLGGWFEEVWQSHYNIGNCYYAKKEYGNAIFHWLEAYQIHPQRLENLHKIIEYYRINSKHQLAYQFYYLAKRQLRELANKGTTPDYLFVEKDVYDYKLDYELTIIGYYCNKNGYDLCQICMDVLAYPYLEMSISRNVLSNYKFYAKPIIESSVKESVIIQKLELLLKSESGLQLLDKGFYSSSPSIASLSNERLAICTRYVNYRINDNGSYENKDNIETINILHIISNLDIIDKEGIVQHDVSYDNMYVGIEDMRLFSVNGGETLRYYGNRGMPNATMQVEMGTIDLTTFSTTGVIHPHITNQGRCEKNWVSFFDRKTGETKTIYGWYPLTIGTISSETGNPLFSKTHEIPCPRFFQHLRGSTHGILVDDEIWFICHIVSHEDRRYYYHIFIILDADTYRLKKYSVLFTFEKSPVEYTLGFVYMEKTKSFIIGYSLMDRETKYIEISKSWVENMN
jgi:tetratricopeptide (TPR) repeat protein